MKTNSGTAISVSLLMMPNTRLGIVPRKAPSKAPASIPSQANISATPPNEKATGYPARSTATTAANITSATHSIRSPRREDPGPATGSRCGRRARVRRNRPGERQDGADEIGDPLRDQHRRRGRDQALEYGYEGVGQSAGLAGGFADGPGCEHVVHARDADEYRQRQQEDRRAGNVHPGFLAASGHAAVEDIHANVLVALQGVGSRPA